MIVCASAGAGAGAGACVCREGREGGREGRLGVSSSWILVRLPLAEIRDSTSTEWRGSSDPGIGGEIQRSSDVGVR